MGVWHRSCPTQSVIRFTLVHTTPQSTSIQLDGRLDCASLAQLQQLVSELEPASLTLELSGLLGLDHSAGVYLVQLRNRGATLAGSSLYITQVLQEI